MVFILAFSLFGQSKKTPKFQFTKDKLSGMVSEQPQSHSRGKMAKSSKEVLMNFNPIFYDSDNPLVTKTFADFDNLSNATIFTIYQTDTIAEQELWRIRTPESDIALSTSKAYNNDLSMSYEKGGKAGAAMSTLIQNYKPKKKKANSTDNFIEFGGFSGDASKAFKGQIAEILVYNNVLGAKTLQIIESTMSLKYGFALENEKNYISSEGKKIFEIEEDLTYKNRIFGIGRDDWNGLYQKQSKGIFNENGLTVSLGEAAVSNMDNTAVMENQTFLVFGDNNGSLTLKPASNTTNCMPMVERNWLVQTSGTQAATLSTNVSVDISGIFEKKSTDLKAYLLVIDQSGKGTFLPENVRYVSATELKENKLTFKGVNWDTDQSGKDVFGFTQRGELNVNLKETITLRCDKPNAGVLGYKIDGGIPPYTLTLKESGSLLKEWTEKKYSCAELDLSNLKEASYNLSVKDAFGEEKTMSYTLKTPVPATVELGENRKLSDSNKEITLVPEIKSEDALTYSWTSDKGYASDLSQAIITDPGVYTLKVTTAKGCTTSDSVMINDKLSKKLAIYPTLSADGNFTVEVSFDKKENVAVTVFDMTGRLLFSSQYKNQDYYVIPVHISPVSGNYLINVKSESVEQATKVIVN